MYMCIFNKKNGTTRVSGIPLNKLKTFFNMSKITTFNPALQRSGQKNSHVIYYQRDMKFNKLLS